MGAQARITVVVREFRRMRGIVVIGLMAGATCALGWMTPAGHPKADAVKYYDVGAVWKGQPIELTIHLRNSGTAPLEISSIEGDCRCTAINRGESILAPGRSAEILAKISTETLEGQIERQVRSGLING